MQLSFIHDAWSIRHKLGCSHISLFSDTPLVADVYSAMFTARFLVNSATLSGKLMLLKCITCQDSHQMCTLGISSSTQFTVRELLLYFSCKIIIYWLLYSRPQKLGINSSRLFWFCTHRQCRLSCRIHSITSQSTFDTFPRIRLQAKDSILRDQP